VFKLHVSNNGTNVQLEEINKLYRNGLELFSEQLGINNPNEHFDDYYDGDDINEWMDLRRIETLCERNLLQGFFF